MRHLSLQQISACVDDSLSGVSLEIVKRHLSGCEECRARQVRMQRVDGLLVQMIRHEPGEGWLERVAVEIADRLRDEIDGIPSAPMPPPRPAATLTAASPSAFTPPAVRLPATSPRALRPSAVTPSAGKVFPAAIPTATSSASTLRESLASASARPASAPAADHAAEPPRWQIHAERIAKARREAAGRPRNALPPLLAGLACGALAGALIATLLVAPRPVSREKPAASVPASNPGEPAPSRIAMTPEVATPREAVTAPPAVVPEEPPATVRRAAAPSEPAVRVAKPAPAPPPRAKEPARVTPRPKPPPVRKPAPTPVSASAPSPGADDSEWPMLCGIVVDEAGAPISGARVQFADLKLSTRTDRRGRFCISGPAGHRTMSVVAPGYSPRRQSVTLAEVTPELSVTLGTAP